MIKFIKKYRISFNIGGLAVFLVIMLPNFIWFAMPAPNDILRADSATKIVDAVASICQALFVAALCMIRNKECEKIRITPFIRTAVCCVVFYYIGWIFYYLGFANFLIILSLIIFPCFTFLFFAIDRKNFIAIILIAVFTVCHLVYGSVNFIL